MNISQNLINSESPTAALAKYDASRVSHVLHDRQIEAPIRLLRIALGRADAAGREAAFAAERLATDAKVDPLTTRAAWQGVPTTGSSLAFCQQPR